ncbi:MAG: DNA-processing protein DprA [Victivallales bacterium]|nr:DNA-processing protein DprA [Victivallales bacterium]MCF7889524.1 DNA-processing protein DprA [Victivallales bacterium]
MNDNEACILLNLLNGVGFTKFSTLREKIGKLSDIFSMSVTDLANIHGISKSLAEKIRDIRNSNKLEKELILAENAGVKITTFLDENYPQQLKEISDPPLCLYVKGNLECVFQKSIAVVGTRRLTSYGREMTNFLVSALSISGFTIVSGLAYGVDAVAHKTALENKGHTVAVLGGGLARLHPQDHLELARSIINEGGAVISEFPMEFPPNRKTFPMRNRIISGLCSNVLITEAGTKSGSLITANFALEQGRNIFAVPGNANSPMSKGCNKLIREGAKLTENLDDITEEIAFLPGFSKAELSKNKAKEKFTIDNKTFSEDENKIINCIKYEDKTIDLISMETKLSLSKLLVCLQNLELRRIVSQLPGKRYKLSQ